MRNLGRTGIKVTPLCLGGNVFGWTIDEKVSFQVLDAYVAEGGNFIDTADVYSRWVPGHQGGESEVVLGKWMHERRNREQIVIATKVGMLGSKKSGKADLSRAHILRAVDDALRRLQTDYIDLYQAHADDSETPLEETLDAFADLVKGGKVRAIGASNYRAERLVAALQVSEARSYPRYETVQPVYNLAHREVYEGELENVCRVQHLGVITYSALASGFLTGKYRLGGEMPQTPRATSVKQRYWNEQSFELLADIDEIVERLHVTHSQIALAWQIARPGVTAPIASATSVEQVKELMGALTVQLDQEALDLLNTTDQA